MDKIKKPKVPAAQPKVAPPPAPSGTAAKLFGRGVEAQTGQKPVAKKASSTQAAEIKRAEQKDLSTSAGIAKEGIKIFHSSIQQSIGLLKNLIETRKALKQYLEDNDIKMTKAQNAEAERIDNQIRSAKNSMEIISDEVQEALNTNQQDLLEMIFIDIVNQHVVNVLDESSRKFADLMVDILFKTGDSKKAEDLKAQFAEIENQEFPTAIAIEEGKEEGAGIEADWELIQVEQPQPTPSTLSKKFWALLYGSK